jgi:hypothetical protein
MYRYRNYERITKINFLIEWHFVSVLRERDPQPLPRQPRGRNRDAAIIIIVITTPQQYFFKHVEE